jgi:molybdopterin synthase catalytic subunit
MIRIIMTDGPLAAALPLAVEEAGAVLSFDGIIRELEGDRRLIAIAYDHYEPMATKQMQALGEKVAISHGLLALHAEHSRGRVAVGEVSFRLQVAARHRQEALAAMGEFIDIMKRDVPIWKRPIFRPEEPVGEIVEARL